MILKRLDRDGELRTEQISYQEAQTLLRLELVYAESGMGDFREFMPVTDYDLCKAVLRHERAHAMLQRTLWSNNA